MLRIAINGALGRMGSNVAALVDASDTLEVVAKYDEDSLLTMDTDDIANKFDTLIDFSTPVAAVSALEVCAHHNKPAVVGVTGFDVAQHEKIKQLATCIPIVLAPNMSLGINLCLSLLKQAASAIGADADIEISEAHHKHKKDAPSGTALKMGEVIAESLGSDLSSLAVYDRHSNEVARQAGSIGFQTIRGGDIVGEHTVMFILEGERIEISHKAYSRLIFARGALRAASWIYGKQEGLYDMATVLGL